MNSLIVKMNEQQADDGEHGRAEREDDAPEDLAVRRAVDLGGLVELHGDRVEEPLDEPGVHAQRAAEVDEDRARARVSRPIAGKTSADLES